jgi:hypothetical protein
MMGLAGAIAVELSLQGSSGTGVALTSAGTGGGLWLKVFLAGFSSLFTVCATLSFFLPSFSLEAAVVSLRTQSSAILVFTSIDFVRLAG